MVQIIKLPAIKQKTGRRNDDMAKNRKNWQTCPFQNGEVLTSVYPITGAIAVAVLFWGVIRTWKKVCYTISAEHSERNR